MSNRSIKSSNQLNYDLSTFSYSCPKKKKIIRIHILLTQVG